MHPLTGRQVVSQCRGVGTMVFLMLTFGLPIDAQENSKVDEAGLRKSIERSVQYLSAEVPRWTREQHCRSCHNNSDAARVLMTSRTYGFTVPKTVLADSLDWLKRPNDWDDNGGDERFSDKNLADVHFATSLVQAVETGSISRKQVAAAYLEAGRRLASRQHQNGSWNVVADGTLGSAITYGRELATWTAQQTLIKIDATKHANSIERAQKWLNRIPIHNVPQAAVVLLSGQDPKRLTSSVELLHKGQGSDGGWGPYVTAASEPFDTAIAIIALKTFLDKNQDTGLATDIVKMINLALRYLMTIQEPDGSWTETTRPPGETSYAGRVSTSGWATQAMLACISPRK